MKEIRFAVSALLSFTLIVCATLLAGLGVPAWGFFLIAAALAFGLGCLEWEA